jgi:hypothetical protein
MNELAELRLDITIPVLRDNVHSHMKWERMLADLVHGNEHPRMVWYITLSLNCVVLQVSILF